MIRKGEPIGTSNDAPGMLDKWQGEGKGDQGVEQRPWVRWKKERCRREPDGVPASFGDGEDEGEFEAEHRLGGERKGRVGLVGRREEVERRTPDSRRFLSGVLVLQARALGSGLVKSGRVEKVKAKKKENLKKRRRKEGDESNQEPCTKEKNRRGLSATSYMNEPHHRQPRRPLTSTTIPEAQKYASIFGPRPIQRSTPYNHVARAPAKTWAAVDWEFVPGSSSPEEEIGSAPRFQLPPSSYTLRLRSSPTSKATIALGYYRTSTTQAGARPPKAYLVSLGETLEWLACFADDLSTLKAMFNTSLDITSHPCPSVLSSPPSKERRSVMICVNYLAA
ncbi:hypothetical protein NMY22_g7374 [Coprinellus aureogranulatus]|nr:hypothetical protein NMY22_g7374 [Coprinellus aureogranulatus]